ncbi:unnamed protein product [Prorocentrum cordatum]|uniref:C3H1-type domain-containing protein n=1 Tax=Prorocentrum cordatum TaxID=2364126 RepID=A0ABN9X4R2_9DINO|nr:unnamed protein product [Polarella glacialis]
MARKRWAQWRWTAYPFSSLPRSSRYSLESQQDLYPTVYGKSSHSSTLVTLRALPIRSQNGPASPQRAVQKRSRTDKVLGSALDLVGAYLKNYEVDKAGAVAESVLPLCRARGGLWRLKVLNHLSTVRMKQARPSEALEMLREVEACVNASGIEHDEAWEFWETTYRNFAWIYSSLDREDDAIGYVQRAIDVKERAGHPVSWFDLWDLGRMRATSALKGSDSGQIKASQDAVTKALWLHREVEPKDFVMRAKIWHSVGECSFAMGFLAEKEGPGAATADERPNGPAQGAEALKHYRKALKCFKESHKLFCKTGGANSPLTGSEAQAVAWTLMKLGEDEESKQHHLGALEALSAQQNGWGDGDLDSKAPALVQAMQIVDRIMEVHRRTGDRQGLASYWPAIEALCTNVCQRLRLCRRLDAAVELYKPTFACANVFGSMLECTVAKVDYEFNTVMTPLVGPQGLQEAPTGFNAGARGPRAGFQSTRERPSTPGVIEDSDLPESVALWAMDTEEAWPHLAGAAGGCCGEDVMSKASRAAKVLTGSAKKGSQSQKAGEFIFTADAPEFVPFSKMGVSVGTGGAGGSSEGRQEERRSRKQREKEKRAGKHEAAVIAANPGVPITTLTISGIPHSYTVDSFRAQLDHWGLAGTYKPGGLVALRRRGRASEPAARPLGLQGRSRAAADLALDYERDGVVHGIDMTRDEEVAMMATRTPEGEVRPPGEPPPQPVGSRNRRRDPDEYVQTYGNQRGSGSKCGLCGEKVGWEPRCRRDLDTPSAAEAARSAGFGETIDCTQESINHMASTLNTVETAVAQLIHMTLRIRTAVAALAHRANPAGGTGWTVGDPSRSSGSGQGPGFDIPITATTPSSISARQPQELSPIPEGEIENETTQWEVSKLVAEEGGWRRVRSEGFAARISSGREASPSALERVADIEARGRGGRVSRQAVEPSGAAAAAAAGVACPATADVVAAPSSRSSMSTSVGPDGSATRWAAIPRGSPMSPDAAPPLRAPASASKRARSALASQRWRRNASSSFARRRTKGCPRDRERMPKLMVCACMASRGLKGGAVGFVSQGAAVSIWLDPSPRRGKIDDLHVRVQLLFRRQQSICRHDLLRGVHLLNLFQLLRLPPDGIQFGLRRHLQNTGLDVEAMRGRVPPRNLQRIQRSARNRCREPWGHKQEPRRELGVVADDRLGLLQLLLQDAILLQEPLDENEFEGTALPSKLQGLEANIAKWNQAAALFEEGRGFALESLDGRFCWRVMRRSGSGASRWGDSGRAGADPAVAVRRRPRDEAAVEHVPEDALSQPMVILMAQPSQWAVDSVNSMLDSKLSPQIREQFNKTKMCTFHKKRRCALGMSCPFAHSKDELQPPPDLFKTKLCYNFFRQRCNDHNCKFAHGYHELRATSHVYKTSICRWFANGLCKAGESCRYAHGLDELRGDVDAALKDLYGDAACLDALDASGMPSSSIWASRPTTLATLGAGPEFMAERAPAEEEVGEAGAAPAADEGGARGDAASGGDLSEALAELELDQEVPMLRQSSAPATTTVLQPRDSLLEGQDIESEMPMMPRHRSWSDGDLKKLCELEEALEGPWDL